MTKASISTINLEEAAHFGALAKDWWDPKGSSAMLHKLNPVRLRFLREQVNTHWGCDPIVFKPLAGKTALDVGCGAGLMCEPLARLGAKVTGVDAAPENVEVARAHAAQQGIELTYHCAEVSTLSGQYDLVTAMEVIEHVSDPMIFASALASKLAKGGLLIVSTPNRTNLSRFAMISLGEGFGAIPKGTHDWQKFITPDEITELATQAGLVEVARSGISFNPSKGFALSDNLALNYLIAFNRY